MMRFLWERAHGRDLVALSACWLGASGIMLAALATSRTAWGDIFFGAIAFCAAFACGVCFEAYGRELEEVQRDG